MKFFTIFVLLISVITAQDEYLKINVNSVETFVNLAVENGNLSYDTLSKKFVVNDNSNWILINNLVQQRNIEQNSYKTPDLVGGLLLGVVSGISFGAHEAYAFNFKKDGWLGDNFIKDWYRWRPQTEAVFGRIFTWHKVFRELDYYSFNKSYSNINRYFGNKWYITYPIVWIVRNTFATMIRDKFKTDNWWYSFDFDLLLSIQLTMP